MPGLLSDVGRHHHLAQIGAVLAPICCQGQPPRRSGRVPMKHDDGGTLLGVAVRSRQLGLHDQAGAVFHQNTPHQAQHRVCAGRLLERRASGPNIEAWGAFERRSPRTSTSALRLRCVGRVSVDHGSVLAQRMPRRNALLDIYIDEQRSRHLVRSPHRHLRPCRGRGESCFAKGVELGIFQQPVRPPMEIREQARGHSRPTADLRARVHAVVRLARSGHSCLVQRNRMVNVGSADFPAFRLAQWKVRLRFQTEFRRCVGKQNHKCRSGDRLCCTSPVWDSSTESSAVAWVHEQT